MSDHSGRFVWYELMCNDAVAARRFYRDVVGWEMRDSGVPGVDYTLLSAGDAPVAGLMALPDEACAAGAKSGWTGYVAVADVDTVAARVRDAGGQVQVAPQDIPDVGRFAVVADPQGASFALFRAPEGCEAPTPAPDAPGITAWRELTAADWPGVFDFYAGLFRWTKADAIDMGEMGVYQLFASGDDTIGGMMSATDLAPGGATPPAWLYYFTVDAIDAAKARVEASGGTVTVDAHEVPGGGWIVRCRDPEGADFALFAPRR